MIPWLLEEYGNASQAYAFARKPKKALADSRATIAECIGAMPEEIFFTSGGTESDNWVIKSSAFFDLEKRATSWSIEFIISWKGWRSDSPSHGSYGYQHLYWFSLRQCKY